MLTDVLPTICLRMARMQTQSIFLGAIQGKKCSWLDPLALWLCISACSGHHLSFEPIGNGDVPETIQHFVSVAWALARAQNPRRPAQKTPAAPPRKPLQTRKALQTKKPFNRKPFNGRVLSDRLCRPHHSILVASTQFRTYA